jgi:hypothetical protein
MARQDQWCWWGKSGEKRKPPLGVLTVLRPGMPFEKQCPATGVAIRIRLAYASDNPSRVFQQDPLSELISLTVDGQTVQPQVVSSEHDKHYLYTLPDATAKAASANLRSLSTREQQSLTVDLQSVGM